MKQILPMFIPRSLSSPCTIKIFSEDILASDIIYLSKKSLVIGTDGGDNCIGFYFGEPTFIFLQPLGDLDLSENRFLSQSFTDMFINWLRIR